MKANAEEVDESLGLDRDRASDLPSDERARLSLDTAVLEVPAKPVAEVEHDLHAPVGEHGVAAVRRVRRATQRPDAPDPRGEFGRRRVLRVPQVESWDPRPEAWDSFAYGSWRS